MNQALELIVDEAAPGHYYWAVMQPGKGTEPPACLEVSIGPYPTHDSASAAGGEAIRRHLQGLGFWTGIPPLGVPMADTVPMILN